MVYKISKSKELVRILAKLSKKDHQLFLNIIKKIDEISNSFDIEHYKNLRYDLKEYKRVHVGSFVLTFKFDRQNQMIYFEDFDHHKKIY